MTKAVQAAVEAPHQWLYEQREKPRLRGLQRLVVWTWHKPPKDIEDLLTRPGGRKAHRDVAGSVERRRGSSCGYVAGKAHDLGRTVSKRQPSSRLRSAHKDIAPLFAVHVRHHDRISEATLRAVQEGGSARLDIQLLTVQLPRLMGGTEHPAPNSRADLRQEASSSCLGGRLERRVEGQGPHDPFRRTTTPNYDAREEKERKREDGDASTEGDDNSGTEED